MGNLPQHENIMALFSFPLWAACNKREQCLKTCCCNQVNPSQLIPKSVRSYSVGNVLGKKTIFWWQEQQNTFHIYIFIFKNFIRKCSDKETPFNVFIGLTEHSIWKRFFLCCFGCKAKLTHVCIKGALKPCLRPGAWAPETAARSTGEVRESYRAGPQGQGPVRAKTQNFSKWFIATKHWEVG